MKIVNINHKNNTFVLAGCVVCNNASFELEVFIQKNFDSMFNLLKKDIGIQLHKKDSGFGDVTKKLPFLVDKCFLELKNLDKESEILDLVFGEGNKKNGSFKQRNLIEVVKKFSGDDGDSMLDKVNKEELSVLENILF